MYNEAFVEQRTDVDSRGQDKETQLDFFKAERRLRLQYAITRILAEAQNLQDAIPRLLQAICIFGGWEFGELWRYTTGKDLLQSEGTWVAPRLEKTIPRNLGRMFPLRRAPGFVITLPSNKPVWKYISPDKDDVLYILEMAKRGMKSVLTFPIETQTSQVGFIILFSLRVHKPESSHVELLQTICKQIGDFIRRKDAEQILEQRERLFRALIEHSSDVITLSGSSGIIRYMSPSVNRILGYTTEEFVGKNLFDFIYQDDRDTTVKLLTTLLHNPGSSSRTEYRLQHKDGSWRWMEAIITNLLEEPSISAIVTNNRDITERKLVEDELREVTESLEHLVDQRTAELQATNKELEAFSYSVAHDLRSPLRAIDGFTRILVEQFATNLDSEGNRLLHIIRENTSKMGRLIDDLLSFAKVGRQELDRALVDMNDLVRIIVEDVQKQYIQHKVKITIQSLPQVYGSYPMMYQVWMNLISNAFKFTREQPFPTIDIGCSTNDQEHVFSVKDNGVGFDMQYKDKLFGVFQRLHPESQYEGTGVGLAIVQRIIHRHSGRVWAESSQNKGAVFFFSLPVKEQE